MKTFSLLSLMLISLFQLAATQNSSAPTTTSSVSMTPEMSASAVSSLYSVLATSSPQQPGNGPAPGDVGSTASAGDSNAGASGSSSAGFELSRGAIIAVIVIACSICIFGAISAVLFYLAKKRDWQIRESIRKSARKVASALTPRRSTFPRDVQKRKSSRGLTRIDEVPNTPRIKNNDIEKGPKLMQFEMTEPPTESKWARKFGR